MRQDERARHVDLDDGYERVIEVLGRVYIGKKAI